MAKWNGKERRENANYCDGHAETMTMLAVFKERVDNIALSVSKIEKHMEDSIKARNGWITAIVGVVFTLLVQTGTIVFYMGQMAKEIEVQGKDYRNLRVEFDEVKTLGSQITRQRLDKIENIIFNKKEIK